MVRRLSWSQLSMYERCPYSWYMNYVKRAVPFKPNIHFTIGSAAHAAIETALGRWNVSRLSVAEMVGVYTNYLNSKLSDPDTITYWTLCGQNMLGAWFAWASQHDLQKISVEGKVIKNNFVGVVDCVCEVDGEPYIIDWKTSGKPYTQKQVDKDGQVTAYKWLTGRTDAKVAYGVLVKGTTKFQFLKSTRSEEDVAAFLKRVSDMRETVITFAEPPEPTPHKNCGWCALYPELCDGEDDF